MPRFLCLPLIGCRNAVLDKPRKMVAHARLSSFVTKEAWRYTIFYITTHARDNMLLFAQNHVANAGAHDHHHTARFGYRCSWHRHMGIHIGDSDGRAWPQTRPASGLGVSLPARSPIGNNSRGSFFHRSHFPTLDPEQRSIFYPGTPPVSTTSLYNQPCRYCVSPRP